MGVNPAESLATLPASVSTPSTSKPRLDMHAACVIPRYPVPNTVSRSGALMCDSAIAVRSSLAQPHSQITRSEAYPPTKVYRRYHAHFAQIGILTRPSLSTADSGAATSRQADVQRGRQVLFRTKP